MNLLTEHRSLRSADEKSRSSARTRLVEPTWRQIRDWLPQGSMLPAAVWTTRHRAITRLALVQAIGLSVFAGVGGRNVVDAFVTLVIVGSPALGGMAISLSRTTRMLSVVTSLMFASATLVGLCDGLTEAHFHFFVMLGVVSLYQDWAAFGLCVLITVAHHAAMGVAVPGSVFASGAQRSNPIAWALVHGGFILAASVTHMVAWKFTEQVERRDPLTQLPNRAEFGDRLQRMLEDSARPVTVLFLDVDNFKSINDSNGHHVGDLALNHIAQTLTEQVRADDVVARIGGDEFAVVVAGDLACGIAIAERVLEQLQRPLIAEAHPILVRASIGVADTELIGSRCGEDLLRGSDAAMYLAKSEGRNRVVQYSPAVDDEVRERAALSRDLLCAIDLDQCEVYYQPVVTGESHELCGVEALVRWHHPERGLIPPAQFIPLAETTGVITAIGDWVLQTAAEQVARWQRELPACESLQLAVNLSPVQLRDPDLVATVSQALQASGLSPQDLIIEVTESMLLTDLDLACRQLDALRVLGTRIALDDFGTGYSSLSYLARLPVDQVKIDQSFVQELACDVSSSIALVRSIVQMARSLSLDIQAEGVEQHDQERILDELGCPRAQGYLYSPPLPAAELAAYVAETNTDHVHTALLFPALALPDTIHVPTLPIARGESLREDHEAAS